ncbi:MAG: ACT domain-containing protein [Acidobacteria bacterium]|nr:MAG: ACT domain-containing protein [Acidobacteriota bacterium]
MKKLKLRVFPEELVVWKLPAGAPLHSVGEPEFWSVTRTSEELSVVSAPRLVAPGCPSETGWRCIAIKGPLPFEEIGVLAALSAPLAEAGISIFVVSTFDTDYLLVKDFQLERARAVLLKAGHDFV